MMKQKLLGISAAALIGLYSGSGHAFAIVGDLLPTLQGASQSIGWGVMTHTEHLMYTCLPNPADPLCMYAFTAGLLNMPWVTVWPDWLLAGVTVLDYAASVAQGDRTIDASKAIKKLKKALEGGCGGGSSGGAGTSGDSSLATVYTADSILTQIEVTNASADTVFSNTRKAIQDYLFETTDTNIKGDCELDDKTCATQRQNEWLLASVTLASATADKVLQMTAKQGASTGSDEGDSQESGGGATTLTAHFQKLASNFNAETSPTGLYNRMADIVLDTHRQINDANALFGRDLEASSLRVINETGPELLDGSETED